MRNATSETLDAPLRIYTSSYPELPVSFTQIQEKFKPDKALIILASLIAGMDVPARRGITPCQEGTRLYQPPKELFLGEQEQVQAGNCSPRNNPLASR
ncbi:hypothetical protein PCASD_17448 [Puccinia coronata f. sp. avenae]|nr:hypothetical protein PCASD_17448 [Puccinia coronata f. sp. avenae]